MRSPLTRPSAEASGRSARASSQSGLGRRRPCRRRDRSSHAADRAGHVRRADPRRQRGHPCDPRCRPDRPAPGRPVGRGRDRAGHGVVRGPCLLRPEGRAQPAPVRLVPRRADPLRVRGAGGAARGGPWPDRPVRAAGRPPALRRVDPAGGSRGSDPPVRGAQGAAGGGGPVRHRAQAAAAGAPGHDRGHHQPDRRRLEGHLPRPRAALAADPDRARGRAGPGRVGAGQPRRRLPQGRSATRRSGSPRAGPTRHQPSPSWPAAGGRWRTSGRSTTRRSCGPWSPIRSRWSAASVTRSTSPWPTSPRMFGRRRRPPPPRSSSRTVPTSSPRCGVAGGAWMRRSRRVSGPRRARCRASDVPSSG